MSDTNYTEGDLIKRKIADELVASDIHFEVDQIIAILDILDKVGVPDMYEALKEADEVICELCKRLNPQHVSADYGKGCNWCQDREDRLDGKTHTLNHSHLSGAHKARTTTVPFGARDDQR